MNNLTSNILNKPKNHICRKNSQNNKKKLVMKNPFLLSKKKLEVKICFMSTQVNKNRSKMKKILKQNISPAKR